MRRRGSASAALAFSTLLFACEASSPAPEGPALDAAAADGGVSTDAAAPVDAQRPAPFVGPTGMTAGCGTVPTARGVLDRTLTVRGAARRYRAVVPETYDETVPHALVFAFHGLGDSAENFQAALRFETVTAGEAIVVYPHGVFSTLGANGWDLDPEGPDFELFDTLLGALSDEFCVDRARVQVLGFSYGGFMTNALGCHRGEVVRAVAPMAATPPMGACVGQVAAWLVHGEADAVVAYPVGTRARDRWRIENGCGNDGATDANGCTAYDGCDPGYPVVFCSHPGGHTVPSFAPRAIWEFFGHGP